MKRIVSILFLFLLASVVFPQQPLKSPESLTPEQEVEIAQKQVVAAAAALDSAKSSFDTALANRNAALYKVLAERGIKPSECSGKGEDGKVLPFACVKIDPVSGAVSVSKLKPQSAKTGNP